MTTYAVETVFLPIPKEGDRVSVERPWRAVVMDGDFALDVVPVGERHEYVVYRHLAWWRLYAPWELRWRRSS